MSHAFRRIAAGGLAGIAAAAVAVIPSQPAWAESLVGTFTWGTQVLTNPQSGTCYDLADGTRLATNLLKPVSEPDRPVVAKVYPQDNCGGTFTLVGKTPKTLTGKSVRFSVGPPSL